MLNLVCLDRDGTINEDKDYLLGSSENWKSQVKILPGVIEGIKKLNKIDNLEVFILTNQSGVALKEGKYPRLTLERMHEVNNYILNILKNKGAFIKGYFACPFVDSKYMERAKLKRRIVNPDFIRDNYPDLKPNTGLVEKAAQSLGKELKECNIYVIGDRLSDVQLGLNSGGIGILVETQEIGNREKVKTLEKDNKGRVYFAKDFLDAADYIIKNLSLLKYNKGYE